MNFICNVIFQLIYSLLYHITILFQYVCYGIIILLFVIGILYRYNYIHRLLWYIAENEASKLLNGTPVTFGYIKFDILRGKVWLSNVVIHSPTRPLKSHIFVVNNYHNKNQQQQQQQQQKSASSQSKTKMTTEWNHFSNNNRKKSSSSSSSVAPRPPTTYYDDTNDSIDDIPTTNDNTIPETSIKNNKNSINKTSYETRPIRHDNEDQIWEWNSPLLGRIGKVYVETNIILVLLSMIFILEEPPLELYTIHLSDIQVFVERQYNIYNFYLCDPHIILPDLQYVVRNSSSNESHNKNNIDIRDNKGMRTDQYNGNNNNNNNNDFNAQNDRKTTSITEILHDDADDDNNKKSRHTNNKQVNNQELLGMSLLQSSHSCPTFINVPETEGSHTQNPTYVKTSSSLDRLSGMTATTNIKFTIANNKNNSSINSSISTKDSSATIQDADDSMNIMDGRKEQKEQHKQQQSVQAQKVVDDMIYAVRRAASKGDWNSILLQQRDMITNQLRTFINNPNTNNEDNHHSNNKETQHNHSSHTNTNSTTTTGSILEVIDDNIKMIQQVGMSVIQKTHSASQKVIPKRMKQLSPNEKEKIVYGRIGRVLIENMRVFVHKTNHMNRFNNNHDNDNDHNDDCNSNENNAQSSLDHNDENNNNIDPNQKQHYRHKIDNLDSTNYIHDRNSYPIVNNDHHNTSQNNSAPTTTSTILPPQKSSVVTNKTAILSKEWNKSIYINRVSIRASEFCPPLSAIDRSYQSNSSTNNDHFNSNNVNNDTNDGMMSSPLRQTHSTPTNTPTRNNKQQQRQKQAHQQQSSKMPCLYQPLDKSIDIIIKRIVAEMAKSNTDLFFQTAMEEMADVFFVSNNNNNNSSGNNNSNKNNKKQQTHPPLSTTTTTSTSATTTPTVGTPKRSS